jgi:hypothetical protein
LESLHIRRIGGECVRLVQKARNSHAHSRTTFQTRLLRLLGPVIRGPRPLCIALQYSYSAQQA